MFNPLSAIRPALGYDFGNDDWFCKIPARGGISTGAYHQDRAFGAARRIFAKCEPGPKAEKRHLW
jgi:hypothetical protein